MLSAIPPLFATLAAYATAAANTFAAGPASGAAAPLSLRALVAADFQAVAPIWSAAHAFTAAGAASTPAMSLTGAPYAGGTSTTNFPLLYLNSAAATASATLSANGTVFGVNSHGTPDLLNLMVDGASKAKVDSAGVLTTAKIALNGNTVLMNLSGGSGDTAVQFNTPASTAFSYIFKQGGAQRFVFYQLDNDFELQGDTGARIVIANSVGGVPKLGFFGVNSVVRQTRGATLTNSVTTGGTIDTIANYTDLATYANDAAAIRNNLYQLARALQQHDVAMRALGFLT